MTTFCLLHRTSLQSSLVPVLLYNGQFYFHFSVEHGAGLPPVGPIISLCVMSLIRHATDSKIGWPIQSCVTSITSFLALTGFSLTLFKGTAVIV